MGKYKFSKDYIKKLTDEKKRDQTTNSRSDPFRTGESVFSHTSETIEHSGPRQVQQHCMNCGALRSFRIDGLGWKYCTSCGAQAPDRSQVPG